MSGHSDRFKLTSVVDCLVEMSLDGEANSTSRTDSYGDRLISKLVEVCEQRNTSLQHCNDFAEHVKRVGADLRDVVTDLHADLVDRGVDVRITRKGISFLFEESSKSIALSTEAARLVYYYVVDLDSTNRLGVPILRTTIVRSDIPALRILLRRGARTSRGADEDLPPLHYARTAECACLLLKHGANPDEKNSNGHGLMFEIVTNNSRMRSSDEQSKTITALLKTEADIAEAMEQVLTGVRSNRLDQSKEWRQLMMVKATRRIGHYLNLTQRDLEKIEARYPLYAKWIKKLVLLDAVRINRLPLTYFLYESADVLMRELRNSEILASLKSFIEDELPSLKIWEEVRDYLAAKLIHLVTRATLEGIAAEVLINNLGNVCYNDEMARAILRPLSSEDVKSLIQIDEDACSELREANRAERKYNKIAKPRRGRYHIKLSF